MNIKERFENVGFTPEEKLDLTARLERAAEQEENMTDATKRKIKRISGGMVFGIAAAVVMTAGALAAVLNPGLRGWFDTQSPGAQETLEKGIYRLDRSETYNGWTVTLAECVGDDNSVYIWADVTAPEGTVLATPGEGYFGTHCWVKGVDGSFRTNSYDDDPTDNHISMLLRSVIMEENPRGKTVSIRLSPIADIWWTEDPETGEAQSHEGSELTAAIRDHEWLFEDVTLDYPDQTIRLEPNAEVPWLDGTTTATRLEVSPLSTYVMVEGGSCEDYVAHELAGPPAEGGDVVFEGLGLIITDLGSDGSWHEKGSEMREALTVELVLQDGTRLTPFNYVSTVCNYKEGAEGPETPYFSFSRRYDDATLRPNRVLDPAQVDHVTVCGVDIPLRPEQGETPAREEPEPAPAADPVTGTVSAGKGLNIRSGPGIGFKVLSALPKGTRLTILGEENGFYKVDFSGGKVGYASKEFISMK